MSRRCCQQVEPVNVEVWCVYWERRRCDRADSKERAYSLSSLAAFSDTIAVPDPEDEVLRIDDRLVRELDGDRM